MDSAQLEWYRQVIENVLNEYAALPYSYAKIEAEVVFDLFELAICGWMWVGMAIDAFMAAWFILTLLMAKFGFSGMVRRMVLQRIWSGLVFRKSR